MSGLVSDPVPYPPHPAGHPAGNHSSPPLPLIGEKLTDQVEDLFSRLESDLIRCAESESYPTMLASLALILNHISNKCSTLKQPDALVFMALLQDALTLYQEGSLPFLARADFQASTAYGSQLLTTWSRALARRHHLEPSLASEREIDHDFTAQLRNGFVVHIQIEEE